MEIANVKEKNIVIHTLKYIFFTHQFLFSLVSFKADGNGL